MVGHSVYLVVLFVEPLFVFGECLLIYRSRERRSLVFERVFGEGVRVGRGGLGKEKGLSKKRAVFEP